MHGVQFSVKAFEANVAAFPSGKFLPNYNAAYEWMLKENFLKLTDFNLLLDADLWRDENGKQGNSPFDAVFCDTSSRPRRWSTGTSWSPTRPGSTPSPRKPSRMPRFARRTTTENPASSTWRTSSLAALGKVRAGQCPSMRSQRSAAAWFGRRLGGSLQIPSRKPLPPE